MDLGDGVQIQFGGSNLLPGDYWQFTARSADGSIELLEDEPSLGITRHRCPLAVVTWSMRPLGSPPQSPPEQTYTLSRIDDCRNVFPPLIDIPRTEAGLHVQRVYTVDQTTGQQTPLINDSSVLVSAIASGINVECDGPVDPATISRPTCFLTVEVPGPTSGGASSPPQPLLAGYAQVSVSATPGVQGNLITWLPNDGARGWLPGIALATPPGDKGILARLTLRGNFISTPTSPPSFLDGEVFGFQQGGINTLALPSGDRRRGGNLEMWFWLIAQPAALASLGLNQLAMFQGDTTTGVVTLTNPATSGLVAALANSTSGVANVPASVSFATGTTSASFPVTAIAAGTTTITASLGSVTRSVTLTVTVRPTTLVALLINPSVVAAGAATTGTITLSQPAPPSTVIALSSSNPAVAGVSATVTATPGVTTVGFTIFTGASGTATISATFGNTVSAPVTAVKTKDKEKEIKEKDKEIVKEITKEKEREKISLEKAIIQEQFVLSDNTRVPLTNAAVGGLTQTANSRAFIRADERPVMPLPG
jgi:hypothetical protein